MIRVMGHGYKMYQNKHERRRKTWARKKWNQYLYVSMIHLNYVPPIIIIIIIILFF